MTISVNGGKIRAFLICVLDNETVRFHDAAVDFVDPAKPVVCIQSLVGVVLPELVYALRVVPLPVHVEEDERSVRFCSNNQYGMKVSCHTL